MMRNQPMPPKKKTKSNAPTQRQLRVGEEIRHGLADVFMRGDAYIPKLDGISITFSEVRVSPDLKHANAYVMPLGGVGDVRMIVTALNEVAPYIRHLISGRLHLKFSPKISFRWDDSFDEAQKINQLMNDPRVRRDVLADNAPPMEDHE
jgi:ribosome-binding factor A